MGGPAVLCLEYSDSITASPNDLLDQAIVMLNRLEARYSRYRDDSLISLINARAGSNTFTPLDAETDALISLGDQLWRESNGLFDLTSGVLRHVWNFQDTSQASPEDLKRWLPLVGWDRVEKDHRGIHLPVAGMEIDLGGLAKEYAVDAVIDFLRRQGAASALVNLAGDIATIGSQQSGEPWQVGIRDPRCSGSAISVELVDSAIATSGTYERVLSSDGRVISHLLNPKTGLPTGGPESVTVIDRHCLTAGAIATVACLQDMSGATAWLQRSELPWLLIDPEHRMSGPIADTPRAAHSDDRTPETTNSLNEHK